MRVRRVVAMAIILLACSVFISLAYAATVGTYESDYVTTKTTYVQGDVVYIQWDVTGSGAPAVNVNIWEGSTYITNIAGSAPTGQGSWNSGTSTPDTYTIQVYNVAGGGLLCSTTFTLTPSIPLPESAFGALATIAACFGALGAFVVVKKRGK